MDGLMTDAGLGQDFRSGFGYSGRDLGGPGGMAENSPAIHLHGLEIRKDFLSRRDL